MTEKLRLVSFLPVVSKIHEQFANEQLRSYARENGLITKEKFAYSKNSSTIAALLKAVDEWKWAKDKGLITTAVFLDLQKALDVIDQSLLLQKLIKTNGISSASMHGFVATLPKEISLSNVTGLTQMRELSPMDSPKDLY